MLIIALVLAVIGLAALVTAVVTSNELIAWVCIGASVIGVLLLIVDAVRERSRNAGHGDAAPETDEADAEPVDYPDETAQDDTEDVEDAEAEDVAAVEAADEHKS